MGPPHHGVTALNLKLEGLTRSDQPGVRLDSYYTISLCGKDASIVQRKSSCALQIPVTER